MKIVSVLFSLLVLVAASFFTIMILMLPIGPIQQLREGHYVEVLGQKHEDSDEFEFEFREQRPKGWYLNDEISSSLKGAVVVSEDWSFYEHSGVDYKQLKDALMDFIKRKRIRGASTITQQVVKNLFLNHEQTFKRKFQEVIISTFFDGQMTKERILEIYLNTAHWGQTQEGENIYGVNEASNYYFNEGPSDLNARQSAFLAMLLPSPNRYMRSFHQGELTAFARQRIYTIVNHMRIKGYIDQQDMNRELSLRFKWEKKGPFEAPYKLDLDLTKKVWTDKEVFSSPESFVAPLDNFSTEYSEVLDNE